MTRRRLTALQRADVFLRASGLCHICGTKIQPGQKWELEHKIALALGGADDASNWSPAHKACHRTKTATDASDTARAKRREAKHWGAKRSTWPQSKWKRTVDGRTVLR